MHRLLTISSFAAAMAFAVPPGWAGALQDMIDSAPAGGTVEPPPGVYHEHLVVSKPVTLDGRNGVIVDGDGTGTVIELSADKSTLRNLKVRNSGRLNNFYDSGIRVRGSFNIVKDNVIEDSLFGIDLHQSHDNIIRRNTVSSKDMPLELRGDSIHLWYSNDNQVEENDLHDSRDFAVWYSSGNTISRNAIRSSRYGIHFMYAHANKVTGNTFADCVVGIFLMYSNDLEIKGNSMLHSWGASGMGMGLKESSGARIYGNKLIGNAIGISFDLSPYDPDSNNRIEGNQIAYNGIGAVFNTEWRGNEFRNNAFNSNFTQVVVNGAGTALGQTWGGNYWDDFNAFDRDGDGRADYHMEIYSYADRIWMEYPDANFFRGGFALEALDFVERLAPFAEPRLLVREARPLTIPPPQEVAEAPKDALEMLSQ